METLPHFLSRSQVNRIHAEGIRNFGGTDGLRDEGLLESAVIQPQQLAYYSDPDLFEIAATYAFHLAENQPFLDGNKRTAAGSAIAFLRTNGINTGFDPMRLYEPMIAIAEKRLDRQGLAEVLRNLCNF